ncbi:MAG TPA: hypothetical protein VGI17_06350 [Solirubrobacterales bacterium]
MTAGIIASAIVAAIYAPAATAASPATAWEINQASFPTNLVPGKESHGNGPAYTMFITNVGGAPASGPVFVTDTLPTGLTVSGAEEPKFKYRGNTSITEEGACEVTGQVVECALFSTVPASAGLTLYIPLKVANMPPTTVTNDVTVRGGGNTTSSSLETLVTATEAPFGILGGPGLSDVVSDESGNMPTAGSEPFLTTFNIGVSKVHDGIPAQAMRSVTTELPRGIVVNPRATTKRCSMSVLAHASATNPQKTCPPESQVGQAFIQPGSQADRFGAPVYNMVPTRGAPAELAFEIAEVLVVVRGGLSGGFRLTAASAELISRFQISEVMFTLWGNPSDPRHDTLREGGAQGEGCLNTPLGCSVPPSSTRFLSMPTSCTEPLEFAATVDSWKGATATASAPLTDREFVPDPVTGCNQLAFEPTISSQATTNAGENPSGLEFSIHQTQDESVGGRSTAPLKDATVSLPEGVSLNPSAANGLDACTEQQMGYAPEGGKIRFATTPQSCPNASKVGTLEVTTPLLEEKLPGAVYVAKPFDNPFGSLLAIYLAIEDEETGIIAKLAGKVEPDPKTGQLTARFTENPELPIEEIELHFFKGVRGVLTTPLTCGTKTTTSTLTPWSTPEGIDVHPTGSFATTAGCYGSESEAPKDFSFTAGTESPLSGAYSPFVLRLSRKDGTQHLTGLETTLPEGLLGKLAGISYCPESGIGQAISREVPEKGKEEQASPSCPSSSEVGKVNVTAGSGISPIPVSGHVYLAGPYKGAPFSFVVIVPAVAGPFDLGTVVDRAAVYIGEYDARPRAVADPLPTIRDGIPLDARSIEVKLDRSQFTLNPTSCEAMAIEGSASTQAGQSASLKNRFQVGECGRLAFKPKLQISLKGQTKRTGHPALKAVVTYPKGGVYANIARAQVNLPHSEFLDQGNIGKACTKVLLAQQACPAKSIYGKVKLWTPLLEKPLEGPVYLAGGYGYKLPALVAELNGQIRVLLAGKVDTGKNKGIRNTFETVPDAPAERFVLEMKGGRKYGLLENSENICKKKQLAGVSFTAQNGKRLQLSTTIANSCGKGKKKSGKGKKTHGSKH